MATRKHDDEEPLYQSERKDAHLAIAERLLKDGFAYREDKGGTGKGECVIFRMPGEDVTFTDEIKGELCKKAEDLKDFVIVRSDGSPVFHLANIVDDIDMGVTHIIRGDDHTENTYRHVAVYKALGADIPKYAHLPMILGDDGARLSKRHGAVSVMQYMEEGFLPEALLNYLVRLGWSHGDQEIFSLEEMIELFALKDVNKAPSAFNTEKLLWLNQHYIKESDPRHIARLLSPHMGDLEIDPSEGPELTRVVELQRERASTLVELAEISAFYYRDFDKFDEKAAKKALKQGAEQPLSVVHSKLSKLDDWSREDIHSIIKATVEELGVGFGKVAMPVRVAVTGGAPSPDLDLTMEMVGQEACLRRIDKAIEYIQAK